MPTQQEQIDYLLRELDKIKDAGCGCNSCANEFSLSITDDPTAQNGSNIINSDAFQISAFDEHLVFENSDNGDPQGPPTTVLKLSDEIIQLIQEDSSNTYDINVNQNILTLLENNNIKSQIDLSLYLDDTNLARITQGLVDGVTGIATITRDDNSTFTIDFSALLGGDYNFRTGINQEFPQFALQRVCPKVGISTSNLTGAICLEYDAAKIGNAHIELIESDREGNVALGMAHNTYTLDLQGAAPYPGFAMKGSKILSKGWRPKDVKIYYDPNGNFNGTIRVYIGELTDVHGGANYVFLEKVMASVNSFNLLNETDFNLYLEDTAFQGNLVTENITKTVQTY